MRKLLAIAIWALPVLSLSQAVDHMTPTEIKAAIAAKPNSGFVSIADFSFSAANCMGQYPDIDLFSPAGWVNALSQSAKSQFKDYVPSEDDTALYLRIVSHGCVIGTAAGPTCDSITRVVLLSNREGTIKVESSRDTPRPHTWQNGYGATASCNDLLSRFPVSEVQNVKNSKGEFLVATFSGTVLLKIYTVKQKHLKQLEL